MVKRQLWRLWPLLAFGGTFGLVIGSSIGSLPAMAQAQSGQLDPVRNPNQVPTARYGRGEAVDISLIIEEWRDRYPTIPVFACVCDAGTCGDADQWPFREYSRYQPFVALGDANAANNETNGFNCFDIETGDRPD
ncbi:MAG: hypothetical protein WA885_06500 [Phormidesmis sp.]